jgi:hypothetical protein
LATSIRVIAPLAAVLIGMRLLLTRQWRAVLWMFPYGAVAILSIFITWPYLWEAPLERFIQVFILMSANPTSLAVLFDGQVHPSNYLPRIFLPENIAITISEALIPLAGLGLLTYFWQNRQKPKNLLEPALILLWFLIPVAYAVLRRAPMYDGFRHFFFIAPPLFIFAGMGVEKIIETATRRRWVLPVLALALLVPHYVSIANLHPYQYTYYNSFVGGTQGAFRLYETDYWLTCYKDAVEEANRRPEITRLVVLREHYIAETYARPGLEVVSSRAEGFYYKKGDYLLLTSRTNEDIMWFKTDPIIFSVGAQDLPFCTVKRLEQ